VDAESRERSCLKVLAEASVEKKREKVKRGATRSEGVVIAQLEDEVREVAAEKEHLEERVSSVWAQTVALVLSKQGVRWRSSAAWPEGVIANHIPGKLSIDPLSKIGAISAQQYAAPRTSFPN
jgi:hypothetical protein